MFFRQKLKQTLCLIDGAISTINDSHHDRALPLFLERIKATIIDFNYNEYNTYSYDSQELQLLMNIAVANYLNTGDKKSLEVLDFCAFYIENESEFANNSLTEKVLLNISYINFLAGNYKKSLKFANNGIEFNFSTRSQYAMGHFYARKGFAEYRLGREEYIESFNTAIEIHIDLKQYSTFEKIVGILKDHFGVNIELPDK